MVLLSPDPLLSAYDLASCERIIAMDRSNYRDLTALGLSNVLMLGDYGFESADVADLYYEPEKAEEVYGMIEVACGRIFEEIDRL